MYYIPFNKPLITGREEHAIGEVIRQGYYSGDGPITAGLQEYLHKRYEYPYVWLTPSCTQALEIAAILTEVGPGDEVIIPSYTFVSSANAFVMRGATPVFADSLPDHPNVDTRQLEALITPRTKVLVVVHYAAMGCEMESILELANHYNLTVVEDAAQGIHAYYNGKALGGIGHCGALSFHETKNIHCGEGGALIVRDRNVAARAEIIREKGTNRSAFLRGEVDKYSWVDIGSSYLPSELNAAFLQPQLEVAEAVTRKRRVLWERYQRQLEGVERKGIRRPVVPEGAEHNGHIYYLTCKDGQQRSELIEKLCINGIQAAFHYQALHDSPYYRNRHDRRRLPNAEHFTEALVRLPLYYDLTEEDIDRVCDVVLSN